MPLKPGTSKNASLNALLCRNDIWQGYAQAKQKCRAMGTGYDSLDDVLQGQGWPQEGLIEICSNQNAFEWQLFCPIIEKVCREGAYIALVTPPYVPYSQGLTQLGLDLDKLIIITPHNKSDFITTLVELNRSSVFQLVMAWPQKLRLTYNELRKIHLAQKDVSGLSVLLRTLDYRNHSSPACLRLSIHLKMQEIAIEIFKQHGRLEGSEMSLPMPVSWQVFAPHRTFNTQDKKINFTKYYEINAQLGRKNKPTVDLDYQNIRTKKLKYEYQVQ